MSFPTARQALVAVTGSHEGPWQRTRGREVGVKVTNLGDGELVILESDGGPPISLHTDGQYPFPKCNRFRFTKQATLFGSKPTHVEVMLG